MVTLVIVLVCLGATGWFFWHTRALPHEELARVKKTKKCESSSFPENGVGKIVGKVRSSSEPLISPFSRRPCVYYNVTIADRLVGVERAGETARQDFEVDDGHGTVTVAASSVTILATAEASPNNVLLKNPTTTMIDFLKRVDFYPPTDVDQLVCHEYCLVEGETVAVHGIAERNPGTAGLVFRGSRVTVSDNPRVL